MSDELLELGDYDPTQPLPERVVQGVSKNGKLPCRCNDKKKAEWPSRNWVIQYPEPPAPRKEPFGRGIEYKVDPRGRKSMAGISLAGSDLMGTLQGALQSLVTTQNSGSLLSGAMSSLGLGAQADSIINGVAAGKPIDNYASSINNLSSKAGILAAANSPNATLDQKAAAQQLLQDENKLNTVISTAVIVTSIAAVGIVGIVLARLLRRPRAN